MAKTMADIIRESAKQGAQTSEPPKVKQADTNSLKVKSDSGT